MSAMARVLLVAMVVCALAGCVRLGFEPHGGQDGGADQGTDALVDAPKPDAPKPEKSKSSTNKLTEGLIGSAN